MAPTWLSTTMQGKPVPKNSQLQVRALASLDHSPYVVQYHHAWLEPQWEAMAVALQAQQEQQAQARQPQVGGCAGGAGWRPCHHNRHYTG